MKLLKGVFICLICGLIACNKDETKPFVPLRKTEKLQDGTSVNFVYATGITQDDNGAIWVSSIGYISKFENQEWKNILPDSILNYVQAAFTDNDGNVWFNELYYNGTEWKSHSDLEKFDFRKIIQDNDNNIWIAGYNSKIVKFNGVEFQFFDSYWTRDIAIDQSGTLWFASYSLLKFDGENWTIPTNDGQPLSARSVEVDNNNNIWIGGGGTGVSMFDGVTWKTFEDDFLGHDVTDILCRKNGEIWATLYQGDEYSYAIYDGKDWHPKQTDIKRLFTIFEDADENIWFGTW